MENSESKYKPLSLMLVEYKAGDPLGFVMAWFSMVPILFIVGLCTVILIRRDLTTIFYMIGLLITEVTNMILKHTIRQGRPLANRSGHFSKYGMPSDHSQISFYAASFFVLLVLFRCSNLPKANNWLSQVSAKIPMIAIAVCTAVLIAVSRVYLEYHTVEQVAVGALIGTVMGCGWFYFVHNVFSMFFFDITNW